MTNNKQSMKLYTERQMKEMFRMGLANSINEDGALNQFAPIKLPSDSLCINCDDSKSTHNICMDCIIKIGKENIELPSDEEIEKGVNCSNLGLRYDYSMSTGFKKGAKWMRDKIQGGNK